MSLTIQAKTRTMLHRPGPLTYSRPAGARVALLRSPILPTDGRNIAISQHGVQRRSTHGNSRSSGRSDKALTPDISIVAKMRTFLLWCDNREFPGCGLAVTRISLARDAPAGRRWPA